MVGHGIPSIYEELLAMFELPMLKARREYVILCTLNQLLHGHYFYISRTSKKKKNQKLHTKLLIEI